MKVNTANLIEIDETKDNNLNVLLSINGKDTPRWEGYNYILNRKALTKGVGKTNLEKVSANGKYEFTSVSECDYFMGNDYLNIKIPLNDLGIEAGEQFAIDLKVADGISEPYNIMNYYIDGDSAPIGRLNYRYNSYHK